MRKRVFTHTDEADTGGINLTPLIDVVFVVLILFILVAPMLHIDKIQLASGIGKENQLVSDQNGIRIDVFANSEIKINNQIVREKELEAVLFALKKISAAPPKLFCDKSAPFGTFQKVKGALERSGFEELDVVLSTM